MVHYSHSFLFDRHRLELSEMNSKKLSSILQKPIFTHWDNEHMKFNNCETLKLNKESVKLGLEYSGGLTNKAIQRLTTKVLNGKNITMWVYGGSSTLGADLGPQNNNLTFHHFVQTWWNNAIAPITGSYMERNVIAVGGVGSKYFGICWKEYLSTNAEIDLFVWEFFMNNPYSKDYTKIIEKFVKTILLYYSQPGLIFTKFSRKSRFNSVETSSNKKDHILLQLAKKYQFTSLNIYRSNFYYNNLVKDFQVDDLYVGIYQLHPSKLAHAQMAYLLITYLKKQILNDLKFRIDRKEELGLKDDWKIFKPPKAAFKTTDGNSKCWTAILPTARFLMRHSLFSLHVIYMKGFRKYINHVWDSNKAVRSDVRGGYLASRRNALIRIILPIDLKAKGHVYASVSGVDNGGKTVIKVNSKQGYNRTLIFDCSKRVYSAQHVYYIGKFPPGENILTLITISGGCLLHGVLVE